jgi:heterodisulfide reductase subunit C
MNWYIHREKRFERELELLRFQGEKARVAAKRAGELIAKLTQKGWTDLKHVAKLADHGEHRLDGCIKYDIGGGFRLVCFKREEKCTTCSLCLKDCAFLRKYGYPKTIADTYDSSRAKDLSVAFECSLCGLCAKVCPAGIDPSRMFPELRRENTATPCR